MTVDQLQQWKSEIEIDIEHVRAVLSQPNDYFSPRGAQHWHQVVSRSEIEERLAGKMRLLKHVNSRLTLTTEAP